MFMSMFNGARAGAATAPGGLKGKFIMGLIGAIAAVGGGAALTNWVSGIQDKLSVDLKEFKEDIQEELDDADAESRPILARIMAAVNKMEIELAKITGLEMTAAGGEKFEYFKSISSTLMDMIDSELDLFYKVKGGSLPNFMQDQDVKNSWSAMRDSYDEEMDAWGKNLLAHAVKLDEIQAAAINPSTGEVMAPGAPTPRPVAPGEPSVAKVRNSESNVKDMQSFLETLPAEVTQLPPGLILMPSGEMDQATRVALDHFARFISKDLGVGNISGTRLETDGTGPKLRQIWELYQNPWTAE